MDHRRISKFLSFVLRHHPEEIGITLDENGWVDVDVLLSAMAEHGRAIRREQLEDIVATNDKQRFAIEDGRIRANQGHSVSVDLDLSERQPPDVLYHGTATRFVDAIRAQGLSKMSRQHVHLSADEATASKVGVRHGKLVILRVDAAAMVRDGHVFFCSKNGVWLVDHVPPEFLESLPVAER